MSEKLTTKQRLFVEAYLANPNATEAARKAGYSGDDNTLAQRGAELVRNSKICDLLKERVEAAIVTTDEVLENVKKIAESAEKDSDRLKGWELLGKYLAMWTDKQQNSGEVSVIFKKRGNNG